VRKEEVSRVMREMGKRGGKARKKKLTAEQLRAIGRKGAAARWKKK